MKKTISHENLPASVMSFSYITTAFSRKGSALSANIVETAAKLDGPAVCWGSEGVLVGKEENDFKCFDSFTKFLAAVKAAGLEDALQGPGPFTVFAPVDSAFDTYKGPLTADLLKYHVVPGKLTASAITSNLPTLNGKEITVSRKFRKTFVDDAIVGQVDNFGGGSAFPVDVMCDNGVIHAISVVLEPN